jgi:uncharacterized protein (TIGR02996 family)
MTHDNPFLQAIIEDPDNDNPRLVYADWLEEHGQPDKAEYLRVQCTLARLPEGDPQRRELEERERGLLANHLGGWLAGRLRDLQDGPPTKDPYDRQVRILAAKYQVLPLLFDMAGWFALGRDGEVVSFQWDEPDSVRKEQDPRVRNIALYQGAKKFPELRLLLSPKPTWSRTCPTCGGTGTPLSLPEIVCYCGGLGWLPPSRQNG